MSEQEPELEAFSKFIVAVEPWLDEVVLVGGWDIVCIASIPVRENSIIFR
jgi:hypothetical protein